MGTVGASRSHMASYTAYQEFFHLRKLRRVDLSGLLNLGLPVLPRIQEYRRGDESKLMLMLFSRRLLALAAGSYTPPYFCLLCVQKTYKYRPLSSFRLPSASSTSPILYHSIFTQSCFPRILPSSLFSSCLSSRRSVRPQRV